MDKTKDSASSGSSGHHEEKVINEKGFHQEHTADLNPLATANLNQKFENPLSQYSKEELLSNVDDFCARFELTNHVAVFRKGALAAQNPSMLNDIAELSPQEVEDLQMESTHKWRQPWRLYWLVGMCSMAAAVQGMDETANNGAVAVYTRTLNIGPIGKYPGARFSQAMSDNITGLVVGAPYLACAILGCWLTEPMNRIFARRGTIFISCFIAAVASIWEGVANSWVNLFLARFVLGLGIGAKSTTVPVYAAETAPAPIRGALVMQWQVWTAFGIMLGNIMGVAFGGLGDDLSWRLMLGSTVVLPLFVMAQVYLCPESPRWLIEHGKISAAFDSFKIIRNTELIAARDLYYAWAQVELEREVNKGKNFFTMFAELFTIPRNRRATWATWIVMFGQQFCGVNVIAYYSTNIFLEGGYSMTSALLASMGTGILNFVFALPAFFTIDSFGRRNLLLVTFPFLAIFLFWTGFSFFISPEEPTKRTAMITTGMYLFEVFYSPGMGPVPFSYSAEAFPLPVRDVGMSWATATTWCFNFILSFTWPHLVTAFKPQGAFGWYAGWCIILWILVLLFMPETKELTLEELDQVFGAPTWKHTSYQMKNAAWHLRKWFLFRKEAPLPPFYQGAEKLVEG